MADEKSTCPRRGCAFHAEEAGAFAARLLHLPSREVRFELSGRGCRIWLEARKALGPPDGP